eukprot:9358391-Heterocapsa_arctica.AAC.1
MGQGKHYLNRQKLCKDVQRTRAKILEQMQIFEALPASGAQEHPAAANAAGGNQNLGIASGPKPRGQH